MMSNMKTKMYGDSNIKKNISAWEIKLFKMNASNQIATNKNPNNCKVRGELEPQVEIVENLIGKSGVDVGMIGRTTINLFAVVVDLLMCGWCSYAQCFFINANVERLHSFFTYSWIT